MKKWRAAWWMHRWMKGSFAQYCIKQIQWWSKVSLTVDSGFITFQFMKVSLWFCMKQFCLTHLSDLQLLSKQNQSCASHFWKHNNKMFQEKNKNQKNTRAVPQKWTVKVFLSGIVHIEIDLTYVGSLDNTSRVASWLAEHEQPVKRSLILKIYLSGHKSRQWQKWQFSHFSFKLNGLYY